MCEHFTSDTKEPIHSMGRNHFQNVNTHALSLMQMVTDKNCFRRKTETYAEQMPIELH